MMIPITIAIGMKASASTWKARRSPGRGPGSGMYGSCGSEGWRGESSSPSITCGSCWTSCSSPTRGSLPPACLEEDMRTTARRDLLYSTHPDALGNTQRRLVLSVDDGDDARNVEVLECDAQARGRRFGCVAQAP